MIVERFSDHLIISSNRVLQRKYSAHVIMPLRLQALSQFAVVNEALDGRHELPMVFGIHIKRRVSTYLLQPAAPRADHGSSTSMCLESSPAEGLHPYGRH